MAILKCGRGPALSARLNSTKKEPPRQDGPDRRRRPQQMERMKEAHARQKLAAQKRFLHSRDQPARTVKTVNENHGKALTLQQAAQAAITQAK
jgi:hypothetical protein